MKKILICILFLAILTIGCNKPNKNNEPVTPYNWDVYLVDSVIIQANDYYIEGNWLKIYTDSICDCVTATYPSSQVLKIERIKK